MKSYLTYGLTHYLLAMLSRQGNVKVVLSKNVGRRINELIFLYTYTSDLLLLEEIWQDTG